MPEEFEFMKQVPPRKRKKGFIAQVKEIVSEGGIVPVAWAAKMMGVSNQRVHNLINEGKLRARRADGSNFVAVNLADVEEWLRQHPRTSEEVAFPKRQRA